MPHVRSPVTDLDRQSDRMSHFHPSFLSRILRIEETCESVDLTFAFCLFTLHFQGEETVNRPTSNRPKGAYAAINQATA
jgi:hypothetical protein